MTRNRAILLLSLLLAGAAALAGYGYVQRSRSAPPPLNAAPRVAAAERTILYYRDPRPRPNWSATPKSDAQGRAYLPVYDDAEPSFDPPKAEASLRPQDPLLPQSDGPARHLAGAEEGLDGMDYIAVYDGDEPSDGKTIKVSSIACSVAVCARKPPRRACDASGARGSAPSPSTSAALPS